LKYYEIIYETGNHSIAAYEDDEEAKNAVSAHHNRAKSGQSAQASNPEMGPAERIVKVLKYDEHPATLNEGQVATAEEVVNTVQEAIREDAVGELVSVQTIAAAVRDMSNPTVDSDPHESNYKMQEVGELDWSGE
jgi:hypothetical protein